MKSLWNEAEASRFTGDLGPRVYTSRLLGRDKSLVLHGGGNTSVKIAAPGSPELLYVKSTGSDLAQVDATAFVALRLEQVRRLFDRGRIDNREMMGLLAECISGSTSAAPSIETMLHAALPYLYVEHTHADSILALANVEHADEVVQEVYGELAPMVPYHHSGVELARACREIYERDGTPQTIGLILRFHGVVAFGDTATESYENMLRLVTLAEDYLKDRGAWEIPEAVVTEHVNREELATLRARISRLAGFPLVMRCQRDPESMAYAQRHDLHEVALQGPPTPQHAVFTKRVPQLGRSVEAFTAGYAAYLERTLGKAAAGRLDTAPRIVLDPKLGLCSLGINAEYAAIAGEAYRHDIEIITRASAHGRYRSASEKAIALAELEYGGYETRARADKSKPLLGMVALIMPGAHGTDLSLATRLLEQGAAVVYPGDAIEKESRPQILELPRIDISAALDRICLTFGGLDIVCRSRTDAEPGDAALSLLEHSLADQRVVAVTAPAPSVA